MSASKPLEIAIIGGGLGGTILAIGLIKHNVKVHIYEAAKSFGEIGAGITSGPNALTALSLIDPELLAAYKKHETCNQSPDLDMTFLQVRHGVATRSPSGEDKAIGDLAFDLNDKRNVRTQTNPRSSVHRARFLEEIVKLLPPSTATFNKSLIELEELPELEDNRVRMRFSDGSLAEADAVIGCDGIKSKTRSHLFGDTVQPVFTGSSAYRALVPASDFESEMGPLLTYNGELWLGDSGYLLTYPVDHCALINVIAIKIATREKWTDAAWQIPVTADDFNAEFARYNPKLRKLLLTYGGKDRWALFHLPHDLPYFRNRICLLGDSCHASTPHTGSGASQAMEDAYILSNLIGRVKEKKDLEKAFGAYDAVRRPRSQDVIRMSALAGELFAQRDPETLDNTHRIEAKMLKLLKSIWNIDLPHELQKAEDIMDSV